MYKISMVSLGCPKNQVDAEKMLYLLKNGGFEIGCEEAAADAIIINTCGFIEDAKKEAIDNILEAAQYKKDGNCKALVVTGCLAERYRDDVTEEIPEVDVCVGIGANENICEIVKKAIEGNCKNAFGDKEALNLSGERILGGYPFTTYLKIGDGCDNCCTYCAIPKIRGKMRSRTIEDCVAEAEKGRLSGIHGPVMDLIKVPKEYSVAIEIALGAAGQNIVVDTDGDAKKAIRFLKSENKGRATFLPLTAIKGREFTEKGLDPRIFIFPKSFGSQHESKGDSCQIPLYHLM